MSNPGLPQTAPPPNDTLRRAPLITRVPPPELMATAPLMKWLFAGVLLAIVLVLIPPIALLPGYWIVLASVGLTGALAISALLILAISRRQQRSAAQRRQLVAHFPNWSDDPVAAALAGKWKRTRQTPRPEAVLEAVRAAPTPKPPTARVICLGAVDTPEISDYRFEPVIITPTRFLGRRLWFVPAALVIFAIWLAQWLHLIPIPGRMPLSSFSYFLAMGLAMAALWVWRTTIRPTYLRLAPGMAQVVQFGFRRSKPSIRSYPMTPGTVAIALQPAGTREPRVLWLARGEQLDQVPLWQMQRRHEVTQHLWRALLSTAPTPPLSDEDLLG